MAISSSTVWEVRTAGSDNNGGGFITGSGGTDYSQQNAAQYSAADLASTNGTSGNPSVTSASHSFVAADIGNNLQITGAGTNFLTGFYQIANVAGGAAVLDRACGSAASCSGGTYAVGGALATIQTAYNASVGVNVIYMKAGTYTFTSTFATVNGHASLISGYHLTRNDYDGTRPLITTSTNSTDLFTIGGGTLERLEFDNVNFSNTAATPANGFVAISTHNNLLSMRNSKMTGFTNAINGDDVGAHFTFAMVTLINSEIANCTSHGINLHTSTVGWGGLYMFGCYVHNNSGDGVGGTFATNTGNSANGVYINTIFDSNGGKGCAGSPGGGPVLAIQCNFTNNTSDGLVINEGSSPTPGTGAGSLIANCIAYGNGGFGINAWSTANTEVLGMNNAFGSNTSGGLSTHILGLIGSITLTANPFTSGTNFALNTSAGGGALLVGTGSPQGFGSTTTNTPNVGAWQGNTGGGSPSAKPRAHWG